MVKVSIDGVNQRTVAQMISNAKRMCILWAMGVTQHSQGSDTSTAISNLLLITGNYMRPGTGAYPLRGHNNVQGASDHGSMPNMLPGYQAVDDPEVRQRFEAGCLAAAIDFLQAFGRHLHASEGQAPKP
jgi:predicted molibdopterin-dependent oxidoreductase YjgC